MEKFAGSVADAAVVAQQFSSSHLAFGHERGVHERPYLLFSRRAKLLQLHPPMASISVVAILPIGRPYCPIEERLKQ
jgi:hypothetical protein